MPDTVVIETAPTESAKSDVAETVAAAVAIVDAATDLAKSAAPSADMDGVYRDLHDLRAHIDGRFDELSGRLDDALSKLDNILALELVESLEPEPEPVEDAPPVSIDVVQAGDGTVVEKETVVAPEADNAEIRETKKSKRNWI